MRPAQESALKATNQTVQRSFNRSLVLQKVRQEGRISRVDLSRALGLEKSSVSAIVAELVGQGLLHETEIGEASVSGGRKPVYLALKGDFCCFLSLEIQPTRYHAVILDLNGRILFEKKDELPDWDQPFQTKLRDLYALLDPVVRAQPVPLAHPAGRRSDQRRRFPGHPAGTAGPQSAYRPGSGCFPWPGRGPQRRDPLRTRLRRR